MQSAMLAGIAKLNPPDGVSGFPASSFDFAQGESVLCCMSEALMLNGACPGIRRGYGVWG